MQVSIQSYGDYASSNYGAHTIRVALGVLRLYFSYNTIVSFIDDEDSCTCENVWGATTGKHLNWLEPDKKRRVPRAEFHRRLALCLERHNLTVG